MVKVLKELFARLDDENIHYCHWKSNFQLENALEGKGDLDLLVDRRDVQRFEGVLGLQGFKRAVDVLQAAFSPIFHYFQWDEERGTFVHLHVYYRMVTGESLLKNYHLPLEELLLQSPRRIDGVPVPAAAVELIVFILRIMAKHSSLLEYFLLRRSYPAAQKELSALLAACSMEECHRLLAEWLPGVQPELFDACLQAIEDSKSFSCRYRLAVRLHQRLKAYDRYSSLSKPYRRAVLYLKRIIRRMAGNRRSKRLASGGAVIAFIGPEASGKSTLARQSGRWLGEVFEVEAVHFGRPPSTWLSFLPNLLLPLARKVGDPRRTSRMEENPGGAGEARVSLLYALRAVWVAWDRCALAIKTSRKASGGRIVICDRYSSAAVGAADSAKLAVSAGRGFKSAVLNHLVKLEHDLYGKIPPPDIVIMLKVPLELALDRNRDRQKKGKETDAYLARRHAGFAAHLFPSAAIIELDTNQAEQDVIRSARQIIWKFI